MDDCVNLIDAAASIVAGAASHSRRACRGSPTTWKMRRGQRDKPCTLQVPLSVMADRQVQAHYGRPFVTAQCVRHTRMKRSSNTDGDQHKRDRAAHRISTALRKRLGCRSPSRGSPRFPDCDGPAAQRNPPLATSITAIPIPANALPDFGTALIEVGPIRFRGEMRSPPIKGA